MSGRRFLEIHVRFFGESSAIYAEVHKKLCSSRTTQRRGIGPKPGSDWHGDEAGSNRAIAGVRSARHDRRACGGARSRANVVSRTTQCDHRAASRLVRSGNSQSDRSVAVESQRRYVTTSRFVAVPIRRMLAATRCRIGPSGDASSVSIPCEHVDAARARAADENAPGWTTACTYMHPSPHGAGYQELRRCHHIHEEAIVSEATFPDSIDPRPPLETPPTLP
jgi:hypothetical protein